jgi:hypothetical protein
MRPHLLWLYATLISLPLTIATWLGGMTDWFWPLLYFTIISFSATVTLSAFALTSSRDEISNEFRGYMETLGPERFVKAGHCDDTLHRMTRGRQATVTRTAPVSKHLYRLPLRIGAYVVCGAIAMYLVISLTSAITSDNTASHGPEVQRTYFLPTNAPSYMHSYP